MGRQDETEGDAPGGCERPARSWLRPLVIALPVAALLVGLEVAGRAGGGLNAHLPDVLRVVMGIAAAVGVALFLGWLIVRASPPLLPAVSLEDAVDGRTRSKRRVRNYARWFIVMRWIAVLAATTLVFVTISLASLLSEQLWWPLGLTILVLASLNLVYFVMLRKRWLASQLLPLQVYGDLVVLTTLLHFSGGMENPLSLLMLLHVIIGGIVLPRRRCYEVAAAATILLAVMAMAEASGAIEHYTLEIFPHFPGESEEQHAALYPVFAVTAVGLHGAMLFLTAYFVTSLAERLQRDEQQLESMAARALAERQLLERALETTDTGLRVLDRRLRPQWTSSRWTAWFRGRGAQPGIARRLDGEESAAWKTLEDGEVRVTEIGPGGRPDLPTSDPTGRIFQVTTAPLLDAHERINLVVELAQNVTHQKRLQAEIMRAGKLAAVGQLAGQVAHEVNNPTAVISGKARLLLSNHRDEMSERVAAEIRKITDLADRVAHIARGLLSSSRPLGVRRAPVDIREPIRNALMMAEPLAKAAGVTVEAQLAQAAPSVRANAQELEQVFLNLLLNGLDAMPDGGRLTVSARGAARLRDGSPAVVVAVADTGRGIPEAIRERIFEPFFSTKEEGRGTGLGLAICLGLVESHGGEIEVESHVDRGTRFAVKLPVDAGGSDEDPGGG